MMKKGIFKKILAAFTVSAMLMTGTALTGCGNKGNNSSITENALGAAVKNVRLVTGTPVTLENSPVYQNQAVAVTSESITPIAAATTGKTDKTVTVTRDEKYGGGQFIEKLFTEGLSRAASGEEFAVFQQYLVDHGCNNASLKALAHAVFESQAFNAFNLNRMEKAFCLYRALLSRDPSEAEIMTVTPNNFTQKIDEIIDGEEFGGLLADIRFGSYHWRGNNREMWTGDKVMSAKAFQKLCEEAQNKTVELPQGTLVLVDTSYTMPSDITVRTEGNPEHYVRFARFLRTFPTAPTMAVSSETVLQNIFLDGNVGELNGATFNLPVTGRNNVVWGCRMSDSVAPIHTNPGSSRMYCARNLVTQYATVHSGKQNGWADGIDMYAYNSIIEYNNVVDATDAGIVLFRAREGDADVPQNSIVRYNTICNTGNSAYCGIDNEGVDMIGSGVADFTGVVIYGNALYTSYVAHMHMCITLSARPWTTDYKKVRGVSVYNNYSPKGSFINTAGGIIAEGANDGTVRGNRFDFRLSDWSTNFMGKRHYSVNSDSCEGGDYQSGHLDYSATTFISPVMEIEKESSVNVEQAFVYEDFVPVPAEKFSWNTER